MFKFNTIGIEGWKDRPVQEKGNTRVHRKKDEHHDGLFLSRIPFLSAESLRENSQPVGFCTKEG